MNKPYKQKLMELQGKVDKAAIIDFNTSLSNKQMKYSKRQMINKVYLRHIYNPSQNTQNI